MIEKVITLENISPVDFLGQENKNLNLISQSYPKSKIINRGNEIKVIGPTREVMQINTLLNNMLVFLHKNGALSEEDTTHLMQSGDLSPVKKEADKVILHAQKGVLIKARSANQQKIVDSVLTNDLTFIAGPAGTGKTYMSVALAVKALKDKQVKKIIITRPAVEAGENLGFLPGDMTEKIEPYLKPIDDALTDMITPEKLNFYKENGVIEIAPLAYMRGRTLNQSFVLLDEAQNTSPMQIKMFLTRLGMDSKMVISGDITQIDLPTRQKSGLIDAIEKLKDIEGIGYVELSGTDVVRHKLVKKIIEAYNKHD